MDIYSRSYQGFSLISPWVHPKNNFIWSCRWLDPFSNEEYSILIDSGHSSVCDGCQSCATKNLFYFIFVKTVPMGDEVMIFFWNWGFQIVDDDENTWWFKEMGQNLSDLRNIFEMVIRYGALRIGGLCQGFSKATKYFRYARWSRGIFHCLIHHRHLSILPWLLGIVFGRHPCLRSVCWINRRLLDLYLPRGSIWRMERGFQIPNLNGYTSKPSKTVVN